MTSAVSLCCSELVDDYLKDMRQAQQTFFFLCSKIILFFNLNPFILFLIANWSIAKLPELNLAIYWIKIYGIYLTGNISPYIF